MHKNNLVTLGVRYVFLAAAVQRSWQDEQCGPFFFELLMSVYVKDLVCFYSKVLK